LISAAQTYSHHNIVFSKKNVSLWDYGGSSDLQLTAWGEAVAQADGLVWVVDLSNNDLLAASVEALDKVMKFNSELPLLIAGNKSDLPGSINPMQLSSAFSSFSGANVLTISAKTGDHVNEGRS